MTKVKEKIYKCRNAVEYRRLAYSPFLLDKSIYSLMLPLFRLWFLVFLTLLVVDDAGTEAAVLA